MKFKMKVAAAVAVLLLSAHAAKAEDLVTFEFSGTEYSKIFSTVAACSDPYSSACVPVTSSTASSFSITTPWNYAFSDGSAPTTDPYAWRYYDQIVVTNGVLLTYRGAAGDCGNYQAELDGCYQSSYFLGCSDWIQTFPGQNTAADTGGTRTHLVGTIVTSVPEPTVAGLLL